MRKCIGDEAVRGQNVIIRFAMVKTDFGHHQSIPVYTSEMVYCQESHESSYTALYGGYVIRIDTVFFSLSTEKLCQSRSLPALPAVFNKTIYLQL